MAINDKQQEFQDYRKGIAILKKYFYYQEDKTFYWKLMQSHWIFKFSKILAKNKLCHAFWSYSDNNLSKILNIRDYIQLTEAHRTFTWSRTKEGHSFWGRRVLTALDELKQEYGDKCHLVNNIDDDFAL